jgi:hypothetical protein
VAGDGAVFVVVAEVGVEVTGQLVLGVVCEQSQHHLKVVAAGAQQSDFGLGSMTLAGTWSRVVFAVSRFLRAVVIFSSAAGISLVFLTAGEIARSASSAASSRSAMASISSAACTEAFAFLRPGLSTILVFALISAM